MAWTTDAHHHMARAGIRQIMDSSFALIRPHQHITNGLTMVRNTTAVLPRHETTSGKAIIASTRGIPFLLLKSRQCVYSLHLFCCNQQLIVPIKCQTFWKRSRNCYLCVEFYNGAKRNTSWEQTPIFESTFIWLNQSDSCTSDTPRLSVGILPGLNTKDKMINFVLSAWKFLYLRCTIT